MDELEFLSQVLIVLGTLGGTALGAWLEHWRAKATRLQERLERERELRRAKLEELYQEVDRVRGWWASVSVSAIQVATSGVLPEKQVFQGEPYRIAMLVGIYSPELHPILEKYQHAHDQLASCFMRFIEDPSQKNRDVMLNEDTRFNEVVRAFQKGIASSAQASLSKKDR